MPARASASPPAEAPDRLRRLPSWLLNHLASRANRLVSARLDRAGRRSDYAVLASLEESGPASQAELARRLAIDRGDLVGIINRLGEKGLAVRRPDQRDRRRNAITITDDGRRTLTCLELHIEAAQEELLAPLRPAQRVELLALLKTLIDHHNAPANGSVSEHLDDRE